MKSALKARLTGPNWADELPWVLLGIRTAPKEDLNTSSAELVYGAPLTVPGDFIAQPTLQQTPETVLTRLQDVVNKLKPVPTSRHGMLDFAIPHNLQNSAFVFIRRERHKPPLQRPYEGPFRVISHGDKTFQVDRGGQTETISIDRLKPAHMDLDRPVLVAQPPRLGRPPNGRIH